MRSRLGEGALPRNDYSRAPGRSGVVDLQETPAVPPTDEGGDDRLGFLAAGWTLIALGWGLGVFVNLIAHAIAGTAGMSFLWMRITSTPGPYAWAVFGFGIVTGAIGVGLLSVARATRRGPFVLPGADY